MFDLSQVAEVVQVFAPYFSAPVMIAGGVAVLVAVTAAVVKMFRSA